MKLKNKTLLGIGTLVTIAAPVATVVSCGSSSDSEDKGAPGSTTPIDGGSTTPTDGNTDNTGTDNTGTDNTGTGNTGTDNTGADNTGTGNTGTGNTGTGNTGTGNTGTDNGGATTSPTIGQPGDEDLVTYDSSTNVLTINILDHHRWGSLTVAALNKSLHLYYDNINSIQRVSIDSVVYFEKNGTSGHDFFNFIANSEEKIKAQGGTPYNPNPVNPPSTTPTKVVVDQNTIVSTTIEKTDLTGTRETKIRLFYWFSSWYQNNPDYDFSTPGLITSLRSDTSPNFHITFNGTVYNISFKDILTNLFPGHTYTFTQAYEDLVAAIDAA